MQLQRASSEPIMLPDPTSAWETYNVFNPAVIHHNGLFHMHYRAQGLDWISRIGYAVSEDGLHWNRLREPVLAPIDGTDSRGVEDPRVTKIDGVFYMCYTAYGREHTGVPTHHGGGILPMIARSENLITWERMGSLVRGENNKDHVLFPRKINGRYAALQRRWPNVWIAYSDDLLTWREEDMAPIYGPRTDDPDAWDYTSVGSNGVPIETAHGWLLINHGYNEDHIYKFGVCLVDLDDPTHVIHRPKRAIFGPQELWELRGDVPNVVFSNANPVVDGVVHVYYGGGDHAIGLATCRLDELVDFALNG
jgi:predicted GH43/DUF377 family glycosyl hydrolase